MVSPAACTVVAAAVPLATTGAEVAAASVTGTLFFTSASAKTFRFRRVLLHFTRLPCGIRHGIARLLLGRALLLRGCRKPGHAHSGDNYESLHPEFHSHIALPPGATGRPLQSLDADL